MPVAKVKNISNFDVVVKNLRRRQISCLVIAVSPKTGKFSTDFDTKSKSITSCSQHENSSRKRLFKKKTKTKKESKSLPFLNDDTNSFPGGTPQVTKKRAYRKRSLNQDTREQKKRAKISATDDNIIEQVETPKKRSYRKKSSPMIPKEPKEWLAPVSSVMDVDNALPPPTEGVAQKRQYRKKIPAVPHNTPVNFDPLPQYDSESMGSDFSEPFTTDKRKRGAKKATPSSVTEDESTCTSSSLSQDSVGYTPRRGRRPRWHAEIFDVEEEPEEVSEYELQRQENIKENLRMLKEIFKNSGLVFEEKQPDTPSKTRKNYTKLPLPPPRPKSARLQSSDPLDFSKLFKKLSMD